MSFSIRSVRQRQLPARMAVLIGTRTELAAPLIADRHCLSAAGRAQSLALSL